MTNLHDMINTLLFKDWCGNTAHQSEDSFNNDLIASC